MVSEKFKTVVSFVKEREDPKDVANILSDALNSFSFSAKEAFEYIFAPNATEKIDVGACYSFTALSFAWLKALQNQYQTGHYDGRNECSVTLGTLLSSFEPIQSVSPTLECVWANKVAEEMTKRHRTLQQTFSSVVFKILDFTFEEDEQFKLCLAGAGRDYSGWWHMPLI